MFFRKKKSAVVADESTTNEGASNSETPSTPMSGEYRSSTISSSQSQVTNSTHELGIRLKLMSKYMLGKFQMNKWMSDVIDSDCGILLRQSRGVYVTQPDPAPLLLLNAVQKLNVEVAFTMKSDITDAVFDTLGPGQEDLILPHDGSQYQIVESLHDIMTAPSGLIRKYQYVCLVRSERVVLLWHDTVEGIVAHAQDVEAKLLTLIWGATIPTFFGPQKGVHDSIQSSSHSNTTKAAAKNLSVVPAVTFQEVSELEDTTQDLEKGDRESLSRPLVLVSAIYIGMALSLVIVLLWGFSTKELLVECLVDGHYIRLALIASIPAIMTLTLFFAIVLFSDVFQLIGPVTNLQNNSRYFSAKAPDLALAYQKGFQPADITIQMPVYKESLGGVIEPTVTSLKKAISHYELQGGRANIFINDDGLQGMSEEGARERIEFYQNNNIGWTARPKHGDNGFVRAGKFKKASNMNFALDISNKTEDVLLELVEKKMADDEKREISEHEEDELYNQALTQTIEESGVAWAGGNIRVGELILIVDSDTRVPVDCLIYGAAEMFLSPEVAIIQHSAGVMQVVGNYFENGITFFTNLIYSAIRFGVGNGEVAPFVGHNAFLRWQAVQSVAMKGENGKELFWSESHVSEDFDISLRLQCTGNVVRLGCYHGEGFKEGVSLTVYDELARWEKYAYGCNELVFNPIRYWLIRGPFTKLFLRFLGSSGPICSKIQSLGYIFSYYAMAAGLPFSLLNYFLVGWFNGLYDGFYSGGWRTFLSIIVVFSLTGNVSLAVLRYRLGEKSLIGSLIENFKWLPFFMIFLGGLSFHLNCAILAHMFSIDMSWGATAKELEASNFFKEVPKIFKSFKYMYAFMLVLVVGMIYLARFAPLGYTVDGFTAIVPLAIAIGSHVLLPFALNPALMIFNY